MTRTTPELPLPLQASAPDQQEDAWPPTCDLACNGPTYTLDLQWNLVSNLRNSLRPTDTRKALERVAASTRVGERRETGVKLTATFGKPSALRLKMNSFPTEV
ncbi:hypothetical protein AVEN_95095-1 [Araneus ventricosus]|uniref:Uncharacterized protein n=1 Tax=Araneus ventricosus TaxID=182803 RepID=A0A4Y2P147_ARAVE|nr:hypothetical protein AVEN_95095-1 [Araneus ventricosus]